LSAVHRSLQGAALPIYYKRLKVTRFHTLKPKRVEASGVRYRFPARNFGVTRHSDAGWRVAPPHSGIVDENRHGAHRGVLSANRDISTVQRRNNVLPSSSAGLRIVLPGARVGSATGFDSLRMGNDAVLLFNVAAHISAAEVGVYVHRNKEASGRRSPPSLECGLLPGLRGHQ
jgi:hypothetical protein